MQPEEDLGGRLGEIEAMANRREAKTADEIDAILGELMNLRSKPHSELSGDEQGHLAKIEELLRRYTGWYNNVVAGRSRRVN